MKIGVVGFQGDVEEHIAMFMNISTEQNRDVSLVKIRRKEDLKGISGIVVPGGESTTIYKLTKEYEIYDEVKRMVLENDVPFMGTCAGLILSSSDTADERVTGMGILDVKINRNAYGRQAQSFIKDINIEGMGKFTAVFIRAPIIRDPGSCKVMAYDMGNPVMVRSDKRIGLTFHPELTHDLRIHEYFLNIVEGGGSVSSGSYEIKVGVS